MSDCQYVLIAVVPSRKKVDPSRSCHVTIICDLEETLV